MRTLDLRPNRRRAGLDLRAGQSTLGNGEQYLAAMDSGKKKRLYVMVGGKKRYLKVAGSFTFTPGAALDTTANVGAVVGSFSAVAPSGGAVTITLLADGDSGFDIVGSNLVIENPPSVGSYSLIAMATDATGWKCRLPFTVAIAEAPTIPDVTFSKQLQVGVALSGVTIEDVPVGATVALADPGLVANSAVRPVTVTGTPTLSGNPTNYVTLAGAINSPLAFSPRVLSAAPYNQTPPMLDGLPEAGQTLTAVGDVWANSPTSEQPQWFKKSPGGTVTAYTPGTKRSLVLPTDFVGYQFQCRIDKFNAGGKNTDSPITTPWSDPIVAASPAPPVNNVLPNFTGSALIGSDLTGDDGLWSGASGAKTYRVLRSGQPIPGATSKTYRTTWADAGKPLQLEVTAVNGSGSSTVALSAPFTPSYEFSGAGLGIDAFKHYYTYPTQINPLEIGEARNDARPGTGVLASLSTSNWQPAVIDTRQDVFGVGTKLFSGALTRSVYKLRGGKTIMAVGFDMQGAEFDLSQVANVGYLEGFRDDARGKSPRDQITLGGTTGVSPGPIFILQDFDLYGTGGNHYATEVSATDLRQNTVPVTSAVFTSATTMQITVSGNPLSGIPLADLRDSKNNPVQGILIWGSTYRGVNRNNYDANQQWNVTNVSGSTITLTIDDSTGAVAYTAGNPGGVNNVNLAGATVVAMGYQQNNPIGVRIHPDTIQVNKDKPNLGIYLWRGSCMGGYQAPGIFGNSRMSDSIKEFGLITGVRDATQNPQDRRTTLLFTGGEQFTPAFKNQFFNVWLDNSQVPYQSVGNLFYPYSGITSVNYGVTTITGVAGTDIVTFTGTTGYQGAINLGTPPDGLYGAVDGKFVAPSGSYRPGVGYVSRGWAVIPAFSDGAWAADPFVVSPGTTGGTAGHLKMSASATAGTEFGDITVTGVPSTGYVVDIYISDAAGNVVSNNAIKLEGVIVKKSAGALSTGSYSFYVTAEVFTRDVNFQRVATGIKRTKQITETVAA